MSPRAAWRLETLGFEHVYDDVGGKADWLAHALQREGATANELLAGDVLDDERPTCRLDDDVATLRAALERARHGFCLVMTDQDVVLGRVRPSVLEGAPADATAELLMESGPSTVRADTRARELVERLARRNLRTASGRCSAPASREARGLRIGSRSARTSTNLTSGGPRHTTSGGPRHPDRADRGPNACPGGQVGDSAPRLVPPRLGHSRRGVPPVI
jgi:hypothetical protein